MRWNRFKTEMRRSSSSRDLQVGYVVPHEGSDRFCFVHNKREEGCITSQYSMIYIYKKFCCISFNNVGPKVCSENVGKVSRRSS